MLTLELHQGDDYAVIMRPGESTDAAIVQVCHPDDDDMALLAVMAAGPELLTALEAIGVLPDGYCFCPSNRDATKPPHKHTGECREAVAAIAKAKGLA